MTFLAAAAVGAVFAGGFALALSRSLARIAAGVFLFAQAAILFIVAAGRPGTAAPIEPAMPGHAADPVLQALALTALVIGLGQSAFVLALAYRTHAAHGSVDLHPPGADEPGSGEPGDDAPCGDAGRDEEGR